MFKLTVNVSTADAWIHGHYIIGLLSSAGDKQFNEMIDSYGNQLQKSMIYVQPIKVLLHLPHAGKVEKYEGI